MNGTHTVTALRRWSCQDKALPPVAEIKQIHIYDFDNTLFSSPLPNKQLWNTSTYGQLQGQDFLHNGGWWHNPRILAAVGQGVKVEESRAWEGYWNERIVDLVRLSMQDQSALSVLLTGRRENGFADLIGRMVAAKNLEFDMVALRPSVGPHGQQFGSTMLFKQALLKDIVYTYTNAEEIRVYEDRIKHVKGFRDFFEGVNRGLMSSADAPRATITAEVIQVSEQDTFMDPVTEVEEVQQMINSHNQAFKDGTAPKSAVPYKIKRTVFYTGYIIRKEDSEALKALVKLPANSPDHEVRFLANNILIAPRPAPPPVLKKVGGMGAKMTWRITGLGAFENRVWAARVEPTTPGAQIFTENVPPCVVLATRRQTKPAEAKYIQNWQPILEAQAFEFETTVGEKVLLRIEQEVAEEDAYEASFPSSRNSRKHFREDDFPPLGSSAGKSIPPPLRPQHRGYGTNGAWANKGGGAGGGAGFAAQRGGGNTPRGGTRGSASNRGGSFGGGRGRGAGGGRGKGRGAYRSLDDNVGQGYGGDTMQY